MREERERLEAELKQQAQESQVAAGERNAPNQQRFVTARGQIVSFILTPQMRGVQQIPTISIPARHGSGVDAVGIGAKRFSLTALH